MNKLVKHKENKQPRSTDNIWSITLENDFWLGK